MLYVKDYSHWSDNLNYDVEASKIEMAYLKATEGTSFIDNMYAKHAREFWIRNVPIGAYHYYREGLNPYRQAQHFYDVAKSFMFTAPPALDIEVINNKSLDAGNIFRCLQEIERLFQRKPIIYTGFFVWRDKVRSPSWSTDYRLWIATYGKAPMLPPPWKTWTIWQFNDAFGDENWFNGTLEDLSSFIGDHYTEKPTVEVPKPELPNMGEVQKPTTLAVLNAKFKWVWNTKKKQWIQKKKG